MFSNKTYDFLKWVAQIFLPALGALYFGLGEVWGFPKVNEVIGTITVIDLFLGALLKRSSDKYEESDERFDGSLVIKEDEVTAEVEAPVEALAEQKEVVLKVDDHTDEPVELFTMAEEAPVKKVAKKAPAKKRAPRKVPPK